MHNTTMTGSDRNAIEQPCVGCGKPLLLENAWMEDGCPCNSPAGVNNMSLYRWKLLRDLQQKDSRELAASQEALAKAQVDRDKYYGCLAGMLWSGALDKFTAGESQKMADQFKTDKAEYDALKAKLTRYEEAGKELPGEPHFTNRQSEILWKGTHYDNLRDHDLAQTARVKELEKWQQEMVKIQVSGGKLDGYRRLGERCATLEAERDAAVKALGNCYVMARRELQRLKRIPSVDTVAVERWEHVKRFCEETGLHSQILRAVLPTELTDGSDAAIKAAVKANPCETHLNVRANGGFCPVCLTEERDAAVRDAERYQWLKQPHGNRVPHITQYPYCAKDDLKEFPYFGKVGLDAAIDAAIKAEGEKRE